MENGRRRRRRRFRWRNRRANNANRQPQLQNRENGTRLIDLPDELIHSIMVHVHDFEDHSRVRAAFNTVRRVTDDEVYLRDVDLYLMQTSNLEEGDLWNFKLTCQHRGNASALLLLGSSEFFYWGNVDNGLALIRESALRNYELGIYVYSMLRRIMNPDVDLDRHLVYPDRNLVRRMRQRVKDAYFANRYWGPEELPELYLERQRTFNYRVVYTCPCAELDTWVPIHVESVKGRNMCDLCFITIHAIAFTRFFPWSITRWPIRYHF